jgi:hypothetical protein
MNRADKEALRRADALMGADAAPTIEAADASQPAADFVEHKPHDPLDGLVERAKADPACAFADDVIEALAELRAEDRGRFEAIRAELKRAAVRVGVLDPMIHAAAGDDGGRQTQADALIEIAGECELFHVADGTAFADIRIADRRETWPVKSRGFRRWLGRAFYERHGGVANAESVVAALGLIEARAHYDGAERTIFLRVGEHGGRLYVDLCNSEWQAIEIDADGWRIISEPPCRFRRAAGMLPLPEPTRGGSLVALRGLLNVRSDADFILTGAWLLATFRPRGPYPVLALAGEQGSAKTTFARVLRLLIDPSAASQRTLPREDRDLFIAANNAHVLSFDNVSGLPAWISDTLCRLATGGGFTTRALFTDSDEVIFDATRPISLNGIEDVISRPDLAERAIFLLLEAIAETARRAEREIDAEIDAARPAILGALLDAVSRGLARLSETRLDRLPRMADFAVWAVACGDGVLWEPGGFMAAFDANRAAAIDDVIENDPIASAVRALMQAEAAEARTVWTGTAQTLLGALKERVSETVSKAKAWPDSPRALSARLTRAATFLRSIGIEIERFHAGRAKARMISIRCRPKEDGIFASASSAPSAIAENSHFSADANADAKFAADDLPSAYRPHRPHTVRSNPLKTKPAGDADDADANFPTFGAPENKHMRRGVL